MQCLPTVRLSQRIKSLLPFLFGIGLSGLLALMPIVPSVAISVAEVQNPQQVSGTWVADMADLIESDTEAEINQIISALEAANGTEMAVVTVPDTAGSASPKAFTTELFNTWGLGKEGADNGVLFLVSKGDRRTEVETGYGVEGMLPDGKVGNILDTRVTPQFKAGNFSQGILSGTEAMVLALKGEDFAAVPVVPVVPVTPVESATTEVPTQSANSDRPLNPSLVDTEESKEHFGLTKLLWVLVLSGIAPAIVLAKRRKIGRILYELPPGQIGKTGQQIQKFASPLLYSWTAVWAGGDRKTTTAVTEKGAAAWDFSGRYQWNAWLVEREGWLAIHHRNKTFNRKGPQLFGILLAIALVSRLLHVGLTLEFLLVLGWLAYEITLGACAEDELLKSLAALAKRLITIVLVVSIFLLLGGVIVGWGNSLLVLIPSLGTWAWLMRLVRLSPATPELVCQTCTHPMQLLNSTELRLHISPQQQAEKDIGTVACEGWYCPQCASTSERSPVDSSAVRRFFFDRQKASIQRCHACYTKTLEVTRKTITAATTSRSGSQQVTHNCHYCDYHTSKTITTPRIKPNPSSSSSSYSGSYSSSSSSSSSGSSSSSSGGSSSDGGGSFGGGSSGGGGAGSSW